MNRRRKIYEGKAKDLYEGPEPGTLVQYFKDDATAGNGAKHDIIDGKGVLNNRISEFIFTKLNTLGIPTHFIRRINMREQLIKEVEIIPLEVVVRNVAAGSLVKRLGLEAGTQLPRSIIEFYYKDDALNDPMVSEEHITAFGWATPPELDDIMSLAVRVNDFLTGLFMGVGIQLVDFKIEVGRLYEGETMRIVALALAFGGAAGNLIDRFRARASVVDFIDIGVGGVRFWTFNVADTAVTFGAIILALVLWREDAPAEAEPAPPPVRVDGEAA